MFFWDVILDSSIMPIGSKAKVVMAIAQKLEFKLDQNAIHSAMALRNAFAHHQTGSHPVFVVGKTGAENSVRFEFQVISNSGRITRKNRQDAYVEFVEAFRSAEKSLVDLIVRTKNESSDTVA